MPEEEKEKKIGSLFEKIMKEDIPKLVEEINRQAQEAQRVPKKMDAKRPTPRHSWIAFRNSHGRDDGRYVRP